MMKKYEAPLLSVLVLSSDVLMASDENETDKDFVDNLVVENVENI